MSTSKQSNHTKAPEAAAFVQLMRKVFGEDVRVIYVEEGDFKLGEKSDE